jgi:hypothetical protein
MGQGMVEGTLDWVEDAGEDLLQQGFEEMRSQGQNLDSIICIQPHGMYYRSLRSEL